MLCRTLPCRKGSGRTIGGRGWFAENGRTKRTAANERTGLLLFGAFGLLLALISVGRSGLDYLYKLNSREIVGTVLYSSLSYGANHTAQSYVTYEYVLPDGRSFESTQTG